MPRLRWITVAVAAALLVVALWGGLVSRPPRATESPPARAFSDVRIAFVYDAGTGGGERVLPPLHGAELAVGSAPRDPDLPVGVELVPIDRRADASALDAALNDPTYVAVIGAPHLSGQLELGGRLDAAGVPFVTLSSLGPELSENGWRAWFRVVPGVQREGRAIATWLIDQGFAAEDVCLAGDGSPGSGPLLHAVADDLPGRPAARVHVTAEASVSAVRIVRAGCDSVVWGGFGAAGGALAAAVDAAADTPVVFVGGAGLREPAFAEVAGRAGRGAVSACGCVDVSIETSLLAQRFVQDYQSQFGRPPGPFAAEAWDVARMLMAEIRSGAVTRDDLADALRSAPPFEGLARVYRFGMGGELPPDAAPVALARLQAGRWIPLGA